MQQYYVLFMLSIFFGKSTRSEGLMQQNYFGLQFAGMQQLVNFIE